MRIAQRKESPIIGLTGMGGGLASYILYGGSGSSVYEISRSLRFNASDSAYLKRTPAVVGNNRQFTYAAWVKRTALGTYPRMFGTYDASYIGWDIEFNNSDQIDIHYSNDGSNYPIRRTTAARYRDPLAWLHVVVAVDMTLLTANDRIKLWVNGEQITDFSTIANGNQYDYTNFSTLTEHRIGLNYNYSDFYLADVHLVDGEALDQTSFGEADSYGIWNPKEFTGDHNVAFTPSSYPAVYVTSAPTYGSVANLNNSNGAFTSAGSAGAGSVKVVFDTPITGVTHVKFQGGGYSVNAVFDIKINGTTVLQDLTTVSGYGEDTEALGAAYDITSFEIVSDNDGWALFNLRFSTDNVTYTYPSGTPSIAQESGQNGFHLKFDDTTNPNAIGKDSSGNGTRLPGASFDGTHDYIEIADHADFSFGADDFTMELWCMPRVFDDYKAFVMKYTGTRSTSSWFWTLNSSGNILFYLYHGSSETGVLTSGNGLNLNKWNHVAAVRDGTTCRVYINGVQEGTMNISTNTVNDSSTNVRIGEDSQGFYDYNGLMSNVRIVKGTCLYPSGTTFTPPTSPLTNVTNTKLLCLQSGTSASAATVTPSALVLGGNDSDVFPVEMSELDYTPSAIVTAQTTSEGYSNYVYAGDATYDNTETSKDYFTGTGRDLFNGDLGTQVGSQNISEAWLYFRPATGITSVTSLRLYGSYNAGGIKINGSDSSSSWPNNNAQWVNIANPPSTITEIAVKGSGGAAARMNAIEINGIILTDAAAGTTDSLIDSPSNYTAESGNNGGNYATLNRTSNGVGVLADGNLKYESEATTQHCVASTLAVSSGKWYWEYEILSTGTYLYAGIADINTNFAGNWCGSNSGWSVAVNSSGNICWNNLENHGNVGTSAAAGQIWGWALDLDSPTPTLKLYINGVIQYSGNSIIPTATSLAGRPIVAAAGHLDHKHLRFNFGQQGFSYTPPTGHVALCTQNLPTPAIEQPSEHVGVSTWTGTDITAANTITGLGFSPDLIWTKTRSHNYNHQLVDRIRGGNKTIRSNDATEEVTNEQYGYIDTFNSDGFTSTPGSGDNDYYNGTDKTYVGWFWNAGANSNRTYNVKVVSDSGNKYRFNDHGTSAVTLDLEEGSTYVFDSSDSSVDSHPFVLGTAANSGQYGTGVTYTLDGVEKTYSQYTSGFSAATTRKLTITVPSGAPTLYYWCSVHSGMGGQINTGSGGSTILSNSLTSSAYNTSETWSSSSGTGVADPTNIFDGSLSTGGAISSSGTARTLLTSSGFSARRIRFYKNGNNEGVTYVGVNGTDYAFPFSYTATGWVEVDLGSTITVTSLTTSWAPGAFTLNAIEVDGAILTDSTVTPPTTPAKNAIVRANPDAGFSIIKYATSNADTVAQGTFATGLGGPPEMVLMKTLYDGGQGWTVYHKDIDKVTYAGTSNTGNPLQDYLFLDTAAAATDSGIDTFMPLHYTFGCRGSRNVAGNDQDMIVYAWRGIPGYSKISYYTGNGTSGDGPFVYTGFSPRWIMIKNAADTDSAAADWLIYDTERTPINAVDDALYPNKLNSETAETGHPFDILSNGFKLRSTSSSGLSNASGEVFVYAAFAEYPFRTARAR